VDFRKMIEPLYMPEEQYNMIYFTLALLLKKKHEEFWHSSSIITVHDTLEQAISTF
jgi:hypothetical protein